MVAAIIPVHTAISKQLGESLNTERSRVSGIVIDIKEGEDNSPMLLFGAICVIYGMSVYYFLPYALLNGNFGLLLGIFFAILLGMIFGLTMIAYNFQRLLEVLLVNVFLCCETKSMRLLILSNLTAHK